MVEAPNDGPEVFLVADAIHDGFHFGLGTYFTDGSKLSPYLRRREVGWGFCSVTLDLQLRTGVNGPVTLESATVPVAELLAVISWLKGQLDPFTSTQTVSIFVQAQTNWHKALNEERSSHSGPDCTKLCRDIKELTRCLGVKPTSLQVTSTSLV